jgi:hypothetical protein
MIISPKQTDNTIIIRDDIQKESVSKPALGFTEYKSAFQNPRFALRNKKGVMI